MGISINTVGTNFVVYTNNIKLQQKDISTKLCAFVQAMYKKQAKSDHIDTHNST